jgi:ABC-2 type transport system ATP-binding protein
MSEMALTADHLIILGRGRLLADVSMADMIAAGTAVRIRTPEPDRLTALLAAPGTEVTGHGGTLAVTGRSPEDIATIALAHRILVSELTPVHPSLEDAYLALTHDDVEYQLAIAATIPTASTRRAAA